MLIMLIVPFIECVTFFLLLRNPCIIPKNDSELFTIVPDDIENGPEEPETKLTLSDKFRYMPSLFKYMIPLTLVFLFEYFINQGLVSIQRTHLNQLALRKISNKFLSKFLVGIGAFQKYLA